jgi:1,4-dihydroxy-2-naphthoyl-CoA hydrolase
MTPEQLQQMNQTPPGFDGLLGTEWVEVSGERVVAQLTVRPELHQPTGIVHGGVYATVVETTASVGASVYLDGAGFAVGITNSTDFLRSVREGVLTFTATPVQRGRTLQLWEVAVTDEQDRLVAHGKVKLMNMRGNQPPQ